MTEIPAAILRLLHGNHARFRLNGFQLTVDLRDMAGATMYLQKTWEPNETSIARLILRPGDQVIDLGAHVGYFSVLFASCVGESGRVLAVEPDPENFALLSKNVDDNRLGAIVQCAQAAAADTDGQALLYRSRFNRGDHRLFDAMPNGAEKPARERISVRLLRIDDLVLGWDRLALVKLDVQGFEQRALSGIQATLRRNPRAILLVEYWPWGLKWAGDEPSALLASLRSQDFRLWQIVDGPILRALEPNSLTHVTGEQDYLNLLCARPEADDRLQALLPPAPRGS